MDVPLVAWNKMQPLKSRHWKVRLVFSSFRNLRFVSTSTSHIPRRCQQPWALNQPALCWDLTRRVALSMHTMRHPVTLGSRVPLCPVFSTRRMRRIHATTSWEDGLEGLSRLIKPDLQCKMAGNGSWASRQTQQQCSNFEILSWLQRNVFLYRQISNEPSSSSQWAQFDRLQAQQVDIIHAQGILPCLITTLHF